MSSMISKRIYGDIFWDGRWRSVSNTLSVEYVHHVCVHIRVLAPCKSTIEYGALECSPKYISQFKKQYLNHLYGSLNKGEH